MGFVRWGYQFEGTFQSSDSLEPMAGIYVIWVKKDDSWSVIDVGEAVDVKEKVGKHERAKYWQQNFQGAIYYSALYTPNLQQNGRIEIEDRIRKMTNLPSVRKDE